MWRQWFKQTMVTLVIADDGVVLKDGQRETVLVTQQPSLSEVEHSIRQYRSKLKGKRVKLVLAGSWVSVMVLPWQDHLSRRDDWEALGVQALQKACNNTSENWVCRVALAEYGRPVLVMGISEKFHQLLMTLANDLSFDWKQIKPLNTVLLNKHTGVGKLVVAEPGLITMMQLERESLVGVSVLKPPLGQELVGLQQHLVRLNMLGQQTHQRAKTHVIVSAALPQNWSALQEEQANLVVIKDRGGWNSHAQWIAHLSHASH